MYIYVTEGLCKILGEYVRETRIQGSGIHRVLRRKLTFLHQVCAGRKNTSYLEEVGRIRQETSVRQADEWGMREFQGSSPRMRDRFIFGTIG